MTFSEIDVFGVYVSPIVPMALAAWAVTVALRAAGVRLAPVDLVWHPPLFTLCVFVTVLAAIVLAVSARGVS